LYSVTGKIEVTKITPNHMNFKWHNPNVTFVVDHYYYEIKPLEGPIQTPDLMKKSFCHNEVIVT